jgi:hypothetical protein
MSIQPDMDALNTQRVYEKFRDLAAIGWVIEKAEARGLPVPATYDEIHRMADEWKAKQ